MADVLTGLPAGHVFPAIRFVVDADRSRAYRAATGDVLQFYDEEGYAPSLAVAAFALGALLESVSLPAGTLHTSEALSFAAPVPVGAEVECRAVVTQRSQRGGYVVSVLDSDIRLGGETVLTARATVMSPATPA